MRITPQTTLPVGGPETLRSGSPPGTLLLVGSNALQLTVSMTSGAATVTPYYWSDGVWQPLRGDAASGPVNVQADFATIPVASTTMDRSVMSQWWALLKTGAGVIAFCDLSEATL